MKIIYNMENNEGIYRQFDSSGINLISAYPKVLQIIGGQIPIPEVVEIFPTNFCNFKCPHCRFEGYHGDKNSYLDLNIFSKLLKELKEKNISAIELSGGGEPLMHPEIEKIFEKIINGGFRVGLITNGYPFIYSKKLRKLALKSCNWIRFSVDAFTDSTYQKIHGNDIIYYRRLRKIILEFAMAKRPILSVEMKMLISKNNYQEYELAASEAIEMNMNCLQYKFLGKPLKYALNNKTINDLTKKINRLINKNKNSQTKIELIPAYRGGKNKQKCLMTYLHPVVDWDGEIYICAFFEHRRQSHSIGNIYKGKFFKFWNSPKHKEVFKNIDPATCVPNCPMMRYNPVIDFIKSDAYRFPFI